MYRLLIIAIFFASFANGQTKKPIQKKPVQKTASDSLVKDTVVLDEMPIPKEFAVYSKKPRTKTERMKLCINLVSNQTIFNHCMNDSICKDPEVSKVIFEQKAGDSTYVLVYVEAFSKPLNKFECDAGKEIKLFYFRWNTKTNKALVKQKTICSCMKDITNMTKESVLSWDQSSVLILNYYRSGSSFSEIKFDPKYYLLGLQSAESDK